MLTTGLNLSLIKFDSFCVSLHVTRIKNTRKTNSTVREIPDDPLHGQLRVSFWVCLLNKVVGYIYMIFKNNLIPNHTKQPKPSFCCPHSVLQQPVPMPLLSRARVEPRQCNIQPAAPLWLRSGCPKNKDLLQSLACHLPEAFSCV